MARGGVALKVGVAGKGSGRERGVVGEEGAWRRGGGAIAWEMAWPALEEGAWHLMGLSFGLADANQLFCQNRFEIIYLQH